MLDQVPEEAKDERLARLNEKAWNTSPTIARLGKVEEVLVDGPADSTPGAFYGKSRQNRTVVFRPGIEGRGQGEVKVEKSKIANLYGQSGRAGLLLKRIVW